MTPVELRIAIAGIACGERREEKDNVICGAPELVLSYRLLCIYFRLHIEFRSRAITLTSCLRIDLITWHSSQARVPRVYQLFHIRTVTSTHRQ